jgi:hypothetical protein
MVATCSVLVLVGGALEVVLICGAMEELGGVALTTGKLLSPLSSATRRETCSDLAS